MHVLCQNLRMGTEEEEEGRRRRRRILEEEEEEQAYVTSRGRKRAPRNGVFRRSVGVKSPLFRNPPTRVCIMVCIMDYYVTYALTTNVRNTV